MRVFEEALVIVFWTFAELPHEGGESLFSDVPVLVSEAVDRPLQVVGKNIESLTLH